MSTSSADRIVAELRLVLDDAAPGSRLPSTRDLSARYGVGPVTVQKAVRTLVGLGLVESRPGSGNFVLGARPPKPLEFGWQTSALRSAGGRVPTLSASLRERSVDAIGLHAGFPTRELLPERLVRSALARAARGDAAITHAPAAGSPELRAWFATELASFTPTGIVPVSARDVVVVPGTQSGLGSIFRAIAGPGRSVVMESPTYWGAILSARQAGVDIVPVASDAEGPVPDDLARALAESGARVVYGQPTFANPTGAVWSPARRERVLSTVREFGAFLVEDDWARDFGIEDAPVPIAAYDDSGHVVYVRSLSKSVSPAIRVGAVIARGPVRERLLADRSAESLYVSGVLQSAALDVVLQPAWRTHLRALRGRLRERRDLLVSSIERLVPEAVVERVPAGGLNLWVRLPQHVDSEVLAAACEREGVLVAAGTEWFPTDPSGPYLRLGYAGPDPARYADAAEVIGACVREQLV
ncbi:PLP-dependent aminotransferase family protein [Pseudoclavibacter chungangensis]|uniref:PLP-dependent aminotransferase family protein n=1 Tax=Pseudoclavibacter chungangensis TaxID=587635 RepID=A0A7J5BQ05_9MICO|nr:PLP-dependent aminotransferase family protein [Pseudoclavibacter chungangensis]KAB1655371.1 PLP-dependent aminotransferase family protein [Pseudoclavibacter chungangensis]NYJ68321.1 DNA-binding transcriptional MocR family regulator [Pseudoclavibacter chungangensis]